MAQALARSTQAQWAVTAHKANLLPEALNITSPSSLLEDCQVPAVHNNVAAIHLAQRSPADAEASFRAAVELKLRLR